MLVVINAKDVDEVKDIIGLLLINKKKGFTVYDDETDLIKQILNVHLPLLQKPVELEATTTVEETSPTSPTGNLAEEFMKVDSPSPISNWNLNPVMMKKHLLNWNFNHHHAEPICLEMKDASEFYCDAESSEEDEIDERPVNKPKRGRPSKNTPAFFSSESENSICKKCKNRVRTKSYTFAELSNHALIHTDLKKYTCPIENCIFKARTRSTVAFHIANVHKMESRTVIVPENLSSEERARLERITNECFPNLCNI